MTRRSDVSDVGAIVVRYHPEVGLAVYVQEEDRAVVVWSIDSLHPDPHQPRPLASGTDVADYGEVTYVPPA